MSTPLDPIALRNAYDSEIRRWQPTGQLPAGVSVEPDGPVARITGIRPRMLVVHAPLDDLSPTELDALIARQRDRAGPRGPGVEWEIHAHDERADLPDRLTAAGFVAHRQATIMVGLAVALAPASAVPPPGVRLREVVSRPDLDRVAELEAAVWSPEYRFLGRALAEELSANPGTMSVVVAEAQDTVVCAGWVTYRPGTTFAMLMGGSTRSGWRGRGLYRAVLARRARLAADRGHPYLQVEATAASRPILERQGFVPITTTTLYVYTPPGRRSLDQAADQTKAN